MPMYLCGCTFKTLIFVSFANFRADMQTSDDWPVYHGLIKANLAEERLREENRVGNFLARYAGGDYILSFINKDMNVKHILLTNANDTNLRKCYPGLTSMRSTIDFVTGIKMHFMYGVSHLDFEEPEENSSYRRHDLNCHICDKQYRDKSELYSHLKTHKIVYCQVCHDIIPSGSFFNHKAKCHVKPKFQCDSCPYETLRKHSLQRHKETLHGENAVNCNICSKPFRSQEQLQKHMTSHLGFPCDHCGKKFKTNYYKKRHMAAVHAPDSDCSVDDNTTAPTSPSHCLSNESPRCSVPNPDVLTSTPCHHSAPLPNFQPDLEIDPSDPDSGGDGDPGGGGCCPH